MASHCVRDSCNNASTYSRFSVYLGSARPVAVISSAFKSRTDIRCSSSRDDGIWTPELLARGEALFASDRRVAPDGGTFVAPPPCRCELEPLRCDGGRIRSPLFCRSSSWRPSPSMKYCGLGHPGAWQLTGAHGYHSPAARNLCPHQHSHSRSSNMLASPAKGLLLFVFCGCRFVPPAAGGGADAARSMLLKRSPPPPPKARVKRDVARRDDPRLPRRRMPTLMIDRRRSRLQQQLPSSRGGIGPGMGSTTEPHPAGPATFVTWNVSTRRAGAASCC
mmetsp:Transcript_34072/g.105245  ORF Transcript_34072/g.105245 Transcript_34072/m.105245 type:complete len:277 (-) Transcript_34072:432-1262(-)